MAPNPSPKKPQQQQSSLLSFFRKKPSQSVIENEVMAEQLAVKETASKPVKLDETKQTTSSASSPVAKTMAEPSKPTADAMEIDESIQMIDDDSEDETPIVSKSVTHHDIPLSIKMCSKRMSL